MAQAVGSLAIKLSMDSTGLTTGASKARATLSGMGSSISSMGSMLGGAFATAGGSMISKGLSVIADGFTDVIKKMIDANAQFETLQVSFEGLAGGAAQGAKLMDDLKKFALATPFELTDIAKAAQGMLAYGFSVEQVLPLMKQWGDIAARAPEGAAEGLQKIVRAMGQVRGKTLFRAQEGLQLTEAGVPIWEALAESMFGDKKRVAEVMKKSELGEITSDMAIKAMEGLSKDSRFKGAMEQQSKTFTGLMSNVSDFMTQSAAEMGKPLFDMAKRGIQDFIAFMQGEGGQALTRSVRAFFDAMAAGVNAAERLLSKIDTSWMPTFGEMADTFETVAYTAEWAFNNLEELFDLGSFYVGRFVIKTQNEIGHWGNELMRLFEHIGTEIGDVWRTMSENIVKGMFAAFEGVKGADGKLVDWIKGGMQGPLDLGLQQTLNSIANNFKPVEITPFVFKDRNKTDEEKIIDEMITTLENKLGGGLMEFIKGKRKAKGALNPFGGLGGAPVAAAASMPIAAPFQFAALAMRGSKEAVQAEMRFRAAQQGRQGVNIPEQQLNQQKKAANALEQIKQLLQQPVRPLLAIP